MSDALYEERAQIAIGLARAAIALGYHAGFAKDPEETADWPVLFIDLPTGQVSWHFTKHQREKAPDIGEYCGTWDKHTTAEKYTRLAAWKPNTPKRVVAMRRSSRRRSSARKR